MSPQNHPSGGLILKRFEQRLGRDTAITVDVIEAFIAKAREHGAPDAAQLGGMYESALILTWTPEQEEQHRIEQGPTVRAEAQADVPRPLRPPAYHGAPPSITLHGQAAGWVNADEVVNALRVFKRQTGRDLGLA